MFPSLHAPLGDWINFADLPKLNYLDLPEHVIPKEMKGKSDEDLAKLMIAHGVDLRNTPVETPEEAAAKAKIITECKTLQDVINTMINNVRYSTIATGLRTAHAKLSQLQDLSLDELSQVLSLIHI